MKVSVVIPFSPTDRYRQLALKRVVTHYLEQRWEVCIGHHEGPWCKAAAVARGLQQTTGDLLVIADADCLCDTTPESVEAVEQGAAWASPHRKVRRLRLDGTTEERHDAVRGGGIVVLPRSTYDDVPLDPRFVDWGHEDASWANALEVLAGPMVRGKAELTHLWHPPQDRPSRARGNETSRHLHRRYFHAAVTHDRKAMGTLIEEAKEHGLVFG